MFANRLRRKLWFRWSLTTKLFASYTAVLLILSILFTATYAFIVLERVRNLAEEMTQRNVTTLADALVEEGREEHRSTLRSHAESATRVAREIYNGMEAGEYRPAEARRRVIAYLERQRIGSEGYFYVINSDGTVVYHPRQELVASNQMNFSFIRRQVQRKHGFFDYNWANPEDPEPRQKLGYMAYFAPWDWIITATDYEQGLLNRIESEGIRNLLESYETGTGGAAYVVGPEGKILFNSFSGGRWGETVSTSVSAARPGMRLLRHDVGRTLTYLAWAPLPGYEASAAIVFSGDFMTQAFGVFLPFLAASMVAALIILLVLSKVLANMVTAPVRRIATRFASQTDEELDSEALESSDDLTRLVLQLLRTSVRLEYEEGQREEAQSRLAHLATHDPLTGLPNRSYLDDALERTIGACRRRKLKAAVLFLDIDNFKDINDSYGHPIGDQLLSQMATVLRETLRGEDFVARFGGDEFVMVLPFVDDETQVVEAVRRLMASVRTPLTIGDRSIRPAASIGVAMYPENGDEPGALLQNADAAMYEAKRSGRATYRFHDPAMNQSARVRLAVQDDVRRGLRTDEFQLYWQPIVAASTLQVVRAEALIRWHRNGLITPPTEFIPLVENSPIAYELGQWVARTTAETVNEYEEKLPNPFAVSINVAPSEIVEPRFVQRLVDDLASQPNARGRVEVEVTESAAIHDIATAKGVLAALRSNGIRVHLDDFGEGYASLRYLREFGFDAVKLDRSYLQGVPESSRACSLVGGFVELAHGLGLEVTIEGVETKGQLSFLQELGADFLQGYYIGRPVPVDEFMHTLLERAPSFTLSL